MALDKQDLQEIKKIVDGSVGNAIGKSEVKMSDKIDSAIGKSEVKMSGRIDSAIEKSETRMSGKIDSAIEKSELKMSDKIEFLIEKSEIKMESKMEETVKNAKDEILEVLGTEISDIANNFHEQEKVLDSHEHRIIRVERNLGIKA